MEEQSTVRPVSPPIVGALFRNFSAKEFSVIPARGRGSKLYDVEGREYIDYLLGSGPLLLGHGHPKVLEAIQHQLSRGVQFYFLTEDTEALAREIVAAVPCAESVCFVSTGSEACFFALRLARGFTGRDKILAFEGGYHGWHDYSLMASNTKGQREFPRPDPACAGIPRAIQDLVLVAPFNDLAMTRRIVEAHSHEIAAIIVEPYQRFIPPLPGFLEGLRDLASEHEIVLIFDEVVTGFRLAFGGAQEFYDVQPDVATLGKAVGGGLPLSAVCGRAEIMRVCDPTQKGEPYWVTQLGTFNGNPLASVAGLATLQELKQPGAYDQLHAMGERMRKGIAGILGHLDIPAQVMGEGPTFKVVFSDKPVTDYRSALQADTALLQIFEHEWLRQGIFIAPGWRHYISLAHNENDIDTTLDRMHTAAQRVLHTR